MKNSKTFHECGNHILIKTLRIMRISVFLLSVFVLQTFASDTYSQETRLSMDFSQTRLVDVIDEIEENTEFYFLYNEKLVNLDREVSATFENQKIDKILAKLFEGTDIVYTITDRKIILAPEFLQGEKQQQNTITGVVTDEDGMPLPGVSVQIEGTNIGTITDVNGKYTISDIPENATLKFSFVGMKTVEVEVANQTIINISLSADAMGLEEVVVVGYGSMRKSDLTGAVARVDMEDLSEIANVSVIQAMQGSVAGLNVGAVDQAGESPDISVRGQNSLSSRAADNKPLIVVDGIIFRGNLVDLNTSDIESVDILKDASSAAIYGSQASNGVMIITTKKGAEGKPIINYSGSYSLQTPSSSSLKPMGRDELTNIIKDAYWANGSRIGPDYLEENPDFTVDDKLATIDMINGFVDGTDNSMWDLITRNGFINKQNLSVRGKTKDLGYFFSGGMTDVEGYIMNDNYRKYNYRINLDSKINDWMSVGMESFLTSSDYSGASVSSGRAFNIHPWTPLYDENGNPLTKIQKEQLNPLLEGQIDDSNKRLNLFVNLHADIKLPIKGLNYRLNFSQNYRTNNHDQFDEYAVDYQGSGYKNSSINYDYTVDNILTYIKTFDDVHKVNGTLVYGVEKREQSYTNVSAQVFTDDLLGYYALQEGDPLLRNIQTGGWQEQSLYSMGRINYTYNSK